MHEVRPEQEILAHGQNCYVFYCGASTLYNSLHAFILYTAAKICKPVRFRKNLITHIIDMQAATDSLKKNYRE